MVVGLFIETFVCRTRALGPSNRPLKCNLSLCAVAAWRQILKIERGRCPSCDRSAETYRVSDDEKYRPHCGVFQCVRKAPVTAVRDNPRINDLPNKTSIRRGVIIWWRETGGVPCREPHKSAAPS